MVRQGMLRREVLAGLLGIAPALASCASKDPPPTPASLELEIKPALDQTIDMMIEASPLINPDADNNPTPVVVRIYMLSSQTAFMNADFFQLWEKDEATLGPSMLYRYETIMSPGSARHLGAKLADKTALIGVTVGFRDYRNAKWRALVPYTGDRTSKIKVQITTKSVAVVPQE